MTAVRSDLQREIDFAAEIGQRYIVVPSIAASERSEMTISVTPRL